MKWIFGIFLILSSLLYLCYEYGKTYPYKLYLNFVSGSEKNRYYALSHFDPLFLKGDQFQNDKMEIFKEDYPQLWKKFQLASFEIPLPVRHPLFQTIPIMRPEIRGKRRVLGIKLRSTEKKDLVSIFILPTSLHRDYSFGQDLFKLPYFRNRIKNISTDELWKDIFTYEIEKKDKSSESWIKDLYLLHVRSVFFPKTLKSFYFYEGKGIIELNSSNKDKKVELILESDGRRIHSYLIESSIVDEDGAKLRLKFLREMKPKFVDSSLIRILYTEFKNLNFLRQSDQEGLLYLFSAWTQDETQLELLKEMIFYMERGRHTSDQLKVLYEYAFKKYGKTFTTRNIFQDSEDQNLVLQRKIEIESIEKQNELDRLELESQQVSKPLTQEEKIQNELKKAKEAGEKKKEDEMTIY